MGLTRRSPSRTLPLPMLLFVLVCCTLALVARSVHADAVDTEFYAAAFLTASSHNYLRTTFAAVQEPCPRADFVAVASPSSASSSSEPLRAACVSNDITTICDHSTLEFAPPDRTVYDQAKGQDQTYKMVAYVRDQHASSVLVSLTVPSIGALYSKNTFSHVTVTATDLDGQYGAVYSNVIWARLVNASLILIKRDASGHILSAEFPSPVSGDDLETNLGPWVDDRYEDVSYPATRVYIRLLPTTGPDALEPLHGLVCISDEWHDRPRRCGPLELPTNLPPGLHIGLGIGGGILLVVIMLLACRCAQKRAARAAALEKAMGLHAQLQAAPYQPPQPRTSVDHGRIHLPTHSDAHGMVRGNTAHAASMLM